MLFGSHKNHLPTAEEALPGRSEREFPVPERHTVLGNPLLGPYPEGLEVADFGMGCFWGAERIFWRADGVWTTLVGYQGGHTAEPVVRRGLLRHDRAHRGGARGLRPREDLVREPAQALLGVPRPHAGLPPGQRHRHPVPLGDLHPPARERSGPSQQAEAEASRDAYQKVLNSAGHGDVTTEILPAAGRPFYPAEGYHQQYLDKNPAGYCGIGGTGVSCPIGVAPAGG